MTDLIYDNPEVWDEDQSIFVCPSTLNIQHWIVTSRTDALKNYSVDYSFANGWSCECKAYRYGLNCWHIDYAKTQVCPQQSNAVSYTKYGDGICECGEKLSPMEVALDSIAID
jgi:hypothetical protein